jgi:hypothetical protein
MEGGGIACACLITESNAEARDWAHMVDNSAILQTKMCELPITFCHRKGNSLEGDIMKSLKQHGVSIDGNSE